MTPPRAGGTALTLQGSQRNDNDRRMHEDDDEDEGFRGGFPGITDTVHYDGYTGDEEQPEEDY